MYEFQKGSLGRWALILVVVMGVAGTLWYLSHRPVPPAPVPAPLPVDVQPPASPAPPPTGSAPVVPIKPSIQKPLSVPPKPVVKIKPIPAVAMPLPPPPVVVLPPEPPAPRRWKGNDTAVRRSGQVVIKNDRHWIQFWSEHRPHEAAPELDFSQDMVVGVFSGTRPADAFAIEIVGTRTVDGKLIVDYRERTPPTGTVAVNVSVYPFDIQRIPRTTLPIKFNLLQPQEVSPS